jgi:uncharacterized membrane protein YeaQ/YmgE (transglycosylase-associated protein family)
MMSLVWFLLIGLAAGWLAGQIMRRAAAAGSWAT